jgi:hypothetical protein
MQLRCSCACSAQQGAAAKYACVPLVSRPRPAGLAFDPLRRQRQVASRAASSSDSGASPAPQQPLR